MRRDTKKLSKSTSIFPISICYAVDEYSLDRWVHYEGGEWRKSSLRLLLRRRVSKLSCKSTDSSSISRVLANVYDAYRVCYCYALACHLEHEKNIDSEYTGMNAPAFKRFFFSKYTQVVNRKRRKNM